jgi:hypothetical protein
MNINVFYLSKRFEELLQIFLADLRKFLDQPSNKNFSLPSDLFLLLLNRISRLNNSHLSE